MGQGMSSGLSAPVAPAPLAPSKPKNSSNSGAPKPMNAPMNVAAPLPSPQAGGRKRRNKRNNRKTRKNRSNRH